MSRILSAPWFLAVLALALTLGTQYAALKLYWEELFPESAKVLILKQKDPSPLHWSFSSVEIDRLQRELREGMETVERRSRELDEYAVRVENDRIQVEEIKASVAKLRQDLMDSVIKLEATEVKNLKTLAKTYAVLEPAATVRIFGELDDPTVVKIMFFMKPEMVGELFQEMALQDAQDTKLVERAARLSDMLRLFTDNTNAAEPNT